MRRATSLIIWSTISLLILVWLPLLVLVRVFDRDKTRYRTGYCFRRLGKWISRVNPNWNVSLEGHEQIDDRTPYVMVSNHLSNADIPVISNLPWEMKWVAKKELFALPVVGWMMRLAGDIPVDRKQRKGQVTTFKRAIFYLRNRTSVIFFPEGTRSVDGRLNRFSTGAFELAVREQIPILPIVLDGTQGCLPKNSWIFEPDVYVRLRVLKPISTSKLTREDIPELVERTRERIAVQLAAFRNSDRKEVDALFGKQKSIATDKR